MVKPKRNSKHRGSKDARTIYEVSYEPQKETRQGLPAELHIHRRDSLGNVAQKKLQSRNARGRIEMSEDERKGGGRKKSLRSLKKRFDPLLEDDPEIITPTYYSRSLCMCIVFWRRFLKLFGRFPLAYKIEYADGVREFKNWSCTYSFDWKKPTCMIYVIVTILVTMMASFQWLGLVSALLNCPEHPHINKTHYPKKLRVVEMIFLFHYYFPMVRVLIGSTFMAVSGWLVFYRRHALADLFNFFISIVEELRVDVRPYIFMEMVRSIILYFLCSLFLIAVTGLSYYSYLSVQPTIAAILFLRPFHPNVYVDENFEVVRYFGYFITFYVYIAGQLTMVLYLFNVRLLEIVISIFNTRLDQILSPDITSKRVREYRKNIRRKTFDRLYAQFLSCLDLVLGLNFIYEPIVYTYVASSLAILTFESYYVVKCLVYNDDFHNGSRQLDFQIIFASILQTFVLFFSVISESASALEDTILHTQIFASRRAMPDKDGTPAEVSFCLNVCAHFQSHWELTVGGRKWISLRKTDIMKFILVVQSYFTVFCQFNPELDYWSTDAELHTTIPERKMLFALYEGTGIRPRVHQYPLERGILFYDPRNVRQQSNARRFFEEFGVNYTGDLKCKVENIERVPYLLPENSVLNVDVSVLKVNCSEHADHYHS